MQTCGEKGDSPIVNILGVNFTGKLPFRTTSTRKRHDLTLGCDKVTVAHILTAIQPFFSTGMLSVICLTGHTLSRLGQRNDDYSADFQQHQACHGKTFIEKVGKYNNFY